MYKFTKEERELDSVDVLKPIEVEPYFVVRFTKLGWGLYLDIDDRPVLFHRTVDNEIELKKIRNSIEEDSSTLFNDCLNIIIDGFVFRYSYDIIGENEGNYTGFSTIAISRTTNFMHLYHVNLGFKKFTFNGEDYYDYYLTNIDLRTKEKDFKVKKATIRIP